MIKKITQLLFGQFSWSKPSWLISIQNKAAARPRQFYSVLIGLFLAIIFIYAGYLWYQSLPRPERVIAQITPPKITPVDKVLIPDNLNIDFGIVSHGELNNRPVAPLNLVGKEVTKGVSLTPTMPGKWFWQSDSHLVFIPDADWPAGQTYDVTFSKDFFSKNSKLAELSYSFATLPFEVAITAFKFYQDPVNPQIRQAVATVSFSYPVDTTSLDDKIALIQQRTGEKFKYTMSYDQNKRTAYIHSEPLSLLSTARFLDLILAKGIKPSAGPSVTKDDVKATVLIPDVGSYFKISNTGASIVRNPKDQPEQVLTIETSLGVTSAELNKSLHVYLLPQDYPATPTKDAQKNYQWHDPGEVSPSILTLSKPLDLEAIPADRDFSTLHSYKFHAATPAFIYLKIDKGTHAFGDLALANNYVAVLKAPDYPQEISFLHKGALLALGTDEKLSVRVRGLAAVKFDYARVLPDDVNHLVTQTNGDFSNPYFVDPSFNQNNISEIFSQTQQFDASNPAKEQYSALDLSKYVAKTKNGNNGGPLGLFLLQARGWDTEKDVALDAQTSRLILITDLGLLVKDNFDGTHDIFVQSITKGTPVSQAAVAILGKNGLPLITRSTDSLGHANFPTLSDFTDEREPTVYLVRNGSDVSFMPYSRSDRQLNYSRFDVGGVTNNNENQAALTAYIFSDRGIYRPGDMTHIGMIIKQPYVLPQPAGLPLEVIITDPRGITVKDEKITLNNDGFLTLDYQSNGISQTGQYVVNLYIVKDNHPSSLIGTMTFNVAEFLPDRMRITAHLSKEQTQGWIAPTDLTAKIGLWNLYGAPAVNHRITGKIVLSPQAVTFKEFPDYTFIDPLLDPKTPPKVFTESLSETRTDDQGLAQLDLKLDRFDKATYQLTLFAEGFEAEGGRSVTTQVKALVSPLAYLVGYKPDGDLSYIKQNATRNVHVIAINPQLKQQELTNLKIQLFSQQPVTTLVKKEDGTYQYQSLIQTSLINSQPFSIPEQGIDYSLPSDKIGDYLITITDQNGMELSKFKYNIVGASQQPLPKNAELNIKLNKSEFAPGEDIEIQVTAPYTGSGLITIERDKVYAYQWFKANSTTSLQKIHLPNDFQGNGYINIAFVRDLNSPEIFMSPLSYSVAPFAVTHQQHAIHVDLETPSFARPGEPFPISYKTDKPGKIIVFAVDEGILQVTKYSTPDPLQFFFQKRALEVNTMQIVDQILPKYMADREISAVGGDNGEAALYKNLNPFKRRTEAPVVYWSGIVDTDATSHQLVYQVPDYFNGTLRVMAVAVAADAVGAAATSSVIRGNFVINPNVPTFVAPGDEFDVTASINNNIGGSGAKSDIAIQLTTTPQLEIVGDMKQTITIPEGQERSVHFKVRALSQLGSAELKFTAMLGNKTSHMSATLSVRPAVAYSTSIISGYSSDTKSITLDHVFYPEYRNVEAAISPNPLILVAGLQQYLNEYPYGCTEQLVSKVLPLLAMSKQAWFIQDAKLITDKIQQTVQMLGQRQMSSGAFNYWPETGTTTSNDFATVYALHFLTDAKEQGQVVSNDLFSNGISYLKEFVTQDISNLEQARLHAYAIYLLTRNEIVTTNYLTNLQLSLDKHPDFHWQNDITSAYIAATYQLLKSSVDAEKIITYFKPQTTVDFTNYDFYNNNIANAQYLYLVARHFPNRLSGLNETLVPSLVNAINSDTISTVLSGYTTLAFAAYGQSYPAASNTALSIDEVNKSKRATSLSSASGLYQQAHIDQDAEQVIFNDPSKDGYFYQLIQSGFDKNLPSKVISQGIEVTREYRNADNNSLGSIHLGDEITVHIRIRSIDNQYHDNIAVIDLLPGGFEVVRDSVNSQTFDYVDSREDRVIFFTGVNPDSREIVYRIKATNTGKFIVPPMFATSMYNPMIKSIGLSDSISVD